MSTPPPFPKRKIPSSYIFPDHVLPISKKKCCNYNEEYIARDWLLRSIDENFKTEGINISYPTEVEIDVKGSEKEDSGKAERQKIARKEMDKEDKRLLKDRENARKRLKELGEEILHANLSGEKVYDLEFEAQVLESELSTFDREG